VLREKFQVWMVYYPTNAPIALNRHEINRALDETLRHFDPSGKAPASRDIVIIGHSMGGVLSRLLVSSSGEKLWDDLLQRYELRGERLKKVKSKLGPLLHFDARQDVGRAIFIAAPHRGTDAASKGFGRLVGKLVRLPVTILGKFGDVFEMLVDPNGDEGKPAKPRIPNSIDNLKSDDPFICSAANLPLRPGLKFHSIVAQNKAEIPLAESQDGLVPYWSSHLDGALSEKVIVSGHSVQETPQAILEIRRILHEDLDEHGSAPHAGR
jgi:pimeloyl-ACP methyl ester carboxylesterase